MHTTTRITQANACVIAATLSTVQTVPVTAVSEKVTSLRALAPSPQKT